MNKWKSIKSAPRDGTYILGHIGMSDVLPEIVFWNKKKGWTDSNGESGLLFLYWMQLPKPPKTK